MNLRLSDFRIVAGVALLGATLTAFVAAVYDWLTYRDEGEDGIA